MRLYGVLTILGITTATLLSGQPAYAEASASNSLLLANHKVSILKSQGESPLTISHEPVVIVAKKSEDKTKLANENASQSKNDETSDSTDEQKYVIVASGDSLASIAKANGTTWERLFNANEFIAEPNTITPGDKIRIPAEGEELPDRVSQLNLAQAQNQAQTQGQSANYTQNYVSAASYNTGSGMWCTDYVHSRRPDVPVYGNAGYGWISAAQAQGKATGSTPRAGAVAVMNGHVAYVESVNSDGSYTVSEMGWNYQAGNFNQRTVTAGAFGQFIY